MGEQPARPPSSRSGDERFGARLREDLEALRLTLARPGFGEGPASLGAELELNLVDGAGRPAPINRAVLAETVDRRVTLEVDRFNLEINAEPVPLGGRAFSAVAAGLESALSEVRRAAAACGAEVVVTGILPTLTEADLQSSALTEGHRYRALSEGLRRLRQAPFPVHIEGRDTLDLGWDDVTLEGANTSLQVHLRTAPRDFARTFNAAQLALGPVLAVSGNSPLFLGRRLWDETRIALFRQSVDDRALACEEDWRPARVSFGHGWVRAGAYELFAESVALHEPLLPLVSDEDPLAVARAGRTPALRELRLHHGTIWHWNRAVYDDGSGGHLRVELRALPAGPTVVDMVANAALLVGLVCGLREQIDELMIGCTFGQARRNFYEAARRGPDAELLWPTAPGEAVRPIAARALLERLLPVAREGLKSEGLEADEIDRWLDLVGARAASGRTGARWQAATFEDLRARVSTEDALRELLRRYQHLSLEGRPVATWEAP